MLIVLAKINDINVPRIQIKLYLHIRKARNVPFAEFRFLIQEIYFLENFFQVVLSVHFLQNIEASLNILHFLFAL